MVGVPVRESEQDLGLRSQHKPLEAADLRAEPREQKISLGNPVPLESEEVPVPEKGPSSPHEATPNGQRESRLGHTTSKCSTIGPTGPRVREARVSPPAPTDDAAGRQGERWLPLREEPEQPPRATPTDPVVSAGRTWSPGPRERASRTKEDNPSSLTDPT